MAQEAAKPGAEVARRGAGQRSRLKPIQEQVLDPDSGLTKRGLAEYLALVADRMLPHITGRPISFVRCPGSAP